MKLDLNNSYILYETVELIIQELLTGHKLSNLMSSNEWPETKQDNTWSKQINCLAPLQTTLVSSKTMNGRVHWRNYLVLKGLKTFCYMPKSQKPVSTNCNKTYRELNLRHW